MTERESQERDILIEGAIMGLVSYGTREISRNPRPQLRLQAIVEKVPELTFPCNQSDYYLIVILEPSPSN